MRFGFLNLKLSAVLTAYSLSKLCHQLSLPVGQGLWKQRIRYIWGPGHDR